MSSSSKPLRHDFVPLHRFAKKQMMYFEVQRLYLDYRKQPDGKYRIVLDNISEDAAPKNDFNLFQTRAILLA